MDSTKAAERILPRRTSAKKAQQSFAEQLDSDDSDGGTTNGQGASTTRHSRVSVKKKDINGAKTLLRSASTEDLKHSRGKDIGKAARRSPSPEAVSSPMLPSMASTSAEPSIHSRPHPISKRSGPPLPALAIVTEAQPLGDEMSPLTSLSSFSDQGSPLVEIPKPALKRIPFPESISAPPIPLTTRTSKPFPGPSKVSAWSLSEVGSYGWVLVDKRTFKVYDPEGHDTPEGDEKLWWPAKFDKPGPENTLNVFLFGKGRGYQRVLSPSQDNVLSYHDASFLPRFLVPKFVVPSSSTIDLTSPRKKPKIDRGALEKKWEDALRELKKNMERNSTIITSRNPFEIDEDDDDADDSDASLPEIGKMFNNLYESTLHTATLSRTDTSKKKGKRKRRNSSEMTSYKGAGDFGAVDEDLWAPPEPEYEPGELVLSRDRPSRTVDYWPAKLIEYVPPTNRKQPSRYKITWLDDTEGIVERSWFYTMSEDGFGTCKLGQFQSSFAEVQNDADDEDTQLRRPRSPSPVIEDSSPSAKDFATFGIRLQFQYTKEVLKAILANVYNPTLRKHAQFMKNGKSRQAVVKDSINRGRIDPGEVDLLLVFIKDWCLRDEVRVTHDWRDNVSSTDVHNNSADEKAPRLSSPTLMESSPLSPSEPPPSSLPPSRFEREDSVLSDTSQPGPADTLSVVTEPLSLLDDALNDLPDSVALDPQSSTSRPGQRVPVSRDFESLSNLHKEDYCLNMLVPEAVRQILLWRTGQRSSISLLSPAKEEDLYERGEVLMNERDWVYDIMRYRNLMNKPQGEQQLQGRALGHNRTSSGSRRLRKNVFMPNYQE